MEVKSLTKESLSKQLVSFNSKTSGSNDFDKLFTSTKKTNRDNNYKENDYQKNKKEPVKTSELDRNNQNQQVKKTDKADKTDNVKDTDKISDTEKTDKAEETTNNEDEKIVTGNLEELLMLISETFNLPVNEISEKFVSMLENGEELNINNVLAGMKELLGSDVDLLKLGNLKQFLEQGKILLDNINFKLLENTEEINIEEILRNLVEENEDVFTKLNVTNVEAVETEEVNTDSSKTNETGNLELKATVENNSVKTKETLEKNVEEVTEEIVEEIVDEVKVSTETNSSFSNNSNQFSNNNFTNAQNNQNINPQVVNVNTQVEFTEEVAKTVTKNQTLNQMDNFNVINQIVDKMKVQVKPDVSEIKIALSPEHLGDVSLKIATHNGIVTAQFIAENQRVKELIESQFSSLEDTLRQQGLDVGNLSVEVNDNSQSRQDAYEKGTYDYKGNVSNVGDEEVEESIPLDSLDERGNLVSSKVNIEV